MGARNPNNVCKTRSVGMHFRLSVGCLGIWSWAANRMEVTSCACMDVVICLLCVCVCVCTTTHLCFHRDFVNRENAICSLQFGLFLCNLQFAVCKIVNSNLSSSSSLLLFRLETLKSFFDSNSLWVPKKSDKPKIRTTGSIRMRSVLGERLPDGSDEPTMCVSGIFAVVHLCI